MENHLNAKQRGIIPIAAFAANGDLGALKAALNEGLDAGLTVNEIKEVLVQLYAYAGFPRSLNGLGTFMAVVEERTQLCMDVVQITRGQGGNSHSGRQQQP